MSIIQISKSVCFCMALTVLTIICAHADVPEITKRYPFKVSLDKSATLLLVGQNLESPLTITIGEDVIPITNNNNSSSVTCTIQSRSTPVDVDLIVENEDGVSEDVLSFSNCSEFAQVDEIVRSTDVDISVINTCFPDYEYQLDQNNSINVINSQILLTNLEEGPHQLIIIGHDPAQNKLSSTPISFTVDSIAPEIQLKNTPTIITTNKSETISVTTSTDATHYKYRLDNNYTVENSISEAIVLTSLSLGTHTLSVSGCDSNNHCQSSSDASSITWTIIDISFASNSALTTTTVYAGTQSGFYSTNCSENSVVLEWSVYDYTDNQIGETVVGNTFSFTPAKNGAYAGVYTVDMTAMYDNQTIQTLNAYIQVPFAIETDRYNIIEEAIFSVKGVETGANLIPDIKPNIDTTLDISNIGKWDRTDAESMQITFKPSESLDAVTSFDVRMYIENDQDLNETNGLYEQTKGPFFVIPLKDYSITLSDENGLISTTTNTDITIKEMVTQSNQNLTASESQVRLELPASGGTYYFKVIDNRAPPEFMSESFITNSYESTVILQPVGEYVIEGSVRDSDNNFLENVTVTAFQSTDDTLQSLDYTLPQLYEAKTESNGQYTIHLPESNEIAGWTVIAGKEGYISAMKTDQQANTDVSFNGIHALQLQTQITRVWTEGDNILIQASPSFKNSSEIDIRKITKENDHFYDENQFDSDKISVAIPNADEYTLIIYADTTDNHDPRTGDYTSHAYRKDSTENVLARSDKTMDKFGGAVSLDNNDEAKVEIPVNGITETATITIEQIEKASECNATTGTQYIYAVHATSVNTGNSLNDDQINQIAITLPFDLRTVHPGDIENGIYNIYQADTLEKLENHETEMIVNIRQSDYIGNGKVGSVTVLVDKLSFFSIGIPPERVSGVESTVKDEGGGDCFIGILQ